MLATSSTFQLSMDWNDEKKVFVMREEDRVQAVEYIKALKTKFRDEFEECCSEAKRAKE